MSNGTIQELMESFFHVGDHSYVEQWQMDNAFQALARLSMYVENIPMPDGTRVELHQMLQAIGAEYRAIAERQRQADKNISTLIASNNTLVNLVDNMNTRLQHLEQGGQVVEGSFVHSPPPQTPTPPQNSLRIERKTNERGERTNGERTPDANYINILQYLRMYPEASTQTVADHVGLGKTRVWEIMNVLRSQGYNKGNSWQKQ